MYAYLPPPQVLEHSENPTCFHTKPLPLGWRRGPRRWGGGVATLGSIAWSSGDPSLPCSPGADELPAAPPLVGLLWILCPCWRLLFGVRPPEKKKERKFNTLLCVCVCPPCVYTTQVFIDPKSQRPTNQNVYKHERAGHITGQQQTTFFLFYFVFLSFNWNVSKSKLRGISKIPRLKQRKRKNNRWGLSTAARPIKIAFTAPVYLFFPPSLSLQSKIARHWIHYENNDRE